jgi:hypothetical protein
MIRRSSNTRWSNICQIRVLENAESLLCNGLVAAFGTLGQFVYREVRLRNAMRSVRRALRGDMEPLMDQHVRDRLGHRIPPVFLILAGGRPAEHLGDTCAIYRNKRLNLSGNQRHPA